MSADRFADIRARLEAATPGPWFVVDKGYWSRSVVDEGRGYPAAELQGIRAEDDAEFIANAPADIACLLAEVDRLRDSEALLLNDVLVLMDHHTSEELTMEARRRIIERHGAPAEGDG